MLIVWIYDLTASCGVHFLKNLSRIYRDFKNLIQFLLLKSKYRWVLCNVFCGIFFLCFLYGEGIFISVWVFSSDISVLLSLDKPFVTTDF